MSKSAKERKRGTFNEIIRMARVNHTEGATGNGMIAVSIRQRNAEFKSAIRVLRAIDREPIEIHEQQDAPDIPMFFLTGAEERICREALKARAVAAKRKEVK